MGFLDLEDEVGLNISQGIPKFQRKFVGLPQTSTEKVNQYLERRWLAFRHAKDPKIRPYLSTSDVFEFICLRISEHQPWKTRLSRILHGKKSGCPSCARIITMKNLKKPKPPS